MDAAPECHCARSPSGCTMTPGADICVAGGCGHIGLPLSISFAAKGCRVLIYDINQRTLDTVAQGKMPFMERGAEPLLREALDRGLLSFTSNPAATRGVPTIVITIGTPVDEFHNPSLKPIHNMIDELLPSLSDEQLIIMRSTVFPGVTDAIAKYVLSKGRKTLISYCPERIAQGYAIEELRTLPQIVSGVTQEAEDAAARVFERIAPEVVRLTPVEAELVKLFSNAFRYIHFALSNQFFMIANAAGADFYRVLKGLKHNYPRMADMPGAGFAAGPCLFKDTMQLAAFYRHNFSLGHAAMLVNEGMPQFMVDGLEARHSLEGKTVGILGMAFKGNSDDPRSSLSYKLKKLLALKPCRVLTTDPSAEIDSEIRPLEEVLAQSDILILGAPHRVYKDLDLSNKVLVDIWDFWPKADSG